MKKNKFQEMSIAELKRMLVDNFRIIAGELVKKSLGNLKNTSSIRSLKKDNARILTVLNSKNKK